MTIKMTRAEYEAKYGMKPNVPPKVITSTIQTPQEGGFLERANKDIQQRGANVESAISGTGEYAGQSPIRRGLEATNQAFKAITDVGYQALPENDTLTVRSGLKDLGNKVGSAIGTLTNAIGDNPQLQKWTQEHPEAFKKLEEIFGSAASAGGIAGTILTVNSAAQLAQKGVNTALDVGDKAIEKTGELLKKAGSKLNRSAYNMTTEEAKLVQANEIKSTFLKQELAKTPKGTPEYNELLKKIDDIEANPAVIRADTALKKGIMGTEKSVGVNSGVEKMKLWKDRIEPALRGSKETITKEELFSKAQERVNSEIDPSRQAQFKNALDSLKEDYANIDKYDLLNANKLKTSLDKFTPPRVFKGQEVSNELKMLKSDMADAIRAKTYDSITDTKIKADYRDYANLKQLENVGIKALTEGGKRGGFGNFWSTIKDQLTVPVKTVGGQTLYRVGNTLEFIGKKGLHNLNDYFNDVGLVFRDVANTPPPSTPSSTPSSNEIVGKVDNTKILNEARAYENSVQKLSETAGGWQEGVKKIFDDALHTGDKLTVRALINQNAVPAEYLKTFAKDIQKVLGKTNVVATGSLGGTIQKVGNKFEVFNSAGESQGLFNSMKEAGGVLDMLDTL